MITKTEILQIIQIVMSGLKDLLISWKQNLFQYFIKISKKNLHLENLVERYFNYCFYTMNG